ncbi:MAG: SDR family oxidoreductase [Candidatus Erginobacter occultus]|nr:SDR family oxidoreductase [Candidatus Erginobacter occultus]
MKTAAKILITGISGFLGWNLFDYLAGRFPISGTYNRHRPQLPPERAFRLDLGDPEAAGEIFRQLSPGVIIHCAAVTSPAACLADPELAREVNVAGTERVARAAAAAGARMIYISTDRVFDGKRGDYREADPPNPLGSYGRSKLAGENLVREIVPDHLVLRLPLMYGPPSPFSGSFVEFMREGFGGKTALNLFTDQFRTPLYVEDAGRGIELILKHPEMTGLYHLGGSERIDRAEFGYRMAEVFNCDPAVINPVRMADQPHYPPTPPDASLNSDRFFRETGFRGRGVNEGLRALKTATRRKTGN